MSDRSEGGVEERWRALWNESPQRSPFSRLAYLRAACVAAGLRLDVHFAQRRGIDVAGAAVTWRRRGPYREAVVPPFTPFSAVLLREMPSEAEIHARSSSMESLLAELESAYHAVIVQLHPSIEDVRVPLWRRWEARPFYTYVSAAPSESDPQEGWSESTARNFRTNRGAYEVIEGPDALDAAISLSARSYSRRDRSVPIPEDALRAFARRIVDAGSGSAYAAKHRATGEIAAGIVTLSDAGISYYWLAGGHPGDAMTVLVGEVLERLRTSDCPVLDFVGANTPSIAEFKRRFGCTLRTYYGLTYYGRTDLKLLYKLRRIFR